MAPNSRPTIPLFTERESRYMVAAFQSLKNEPQIDLPPFAIAINLKEGSARNAWAAIRKKLTTKSPKTPNTFSAREGNHIVAAFQCFKIDPQIDLTQFANLIGLKQGSARNAWTAIKRKIEAASGPSDTLNTADTDVENGNKVSNGGKRKRGTGVATTPDLPNKKRATIAPTNEDETFSVIDYDSPLFFQRSDNYAPAEGVSIPVDSLSSDEYLPSSASAKTIKSERPHANKSSSRAKDMMSSAPHAKSEAVLKRERLARLQSLPPLPASASRTESNDDDDDDDDDSARHSHDETLTDEESDRAEEVFDKNTKSTRGEGKSNGNVYEDVYEDEDCYCADEA